ncbi:MAG: SLC13 family permease [Chloroflexi bacterium]|nr:SLC13 family permease [Chloroflexota bacterium]
MTFAQIFVVLVLLIPLTFVFMGRLREDVAALLMAALLGLAQFFGMGILGPAHTPEAASKALTGFGTPEVITLLSLFILTYCLDKYGVTRGIASRLLKIGGHSERRLISLFAVTGALLSMFMNTLAAGALLLPSALDASRRTGVKPSKLLIPIAYGTMLGGAATYLTTANIVISSLLPLAIPPQKPLGVLDFTPTGGLVALAGLAFLSVFGTYILPHREPPSVQVTRSSDELSQTYQLPERLWEAEVSDGSSLINKSLPETHIGELFGLAILGIRRGRRVIPMNTPDYKIEANDVLLVVGSGARAEELANEGLLVHAPQSSTVIDERNTVLAEIIVPPRSNIEGKTLRDLAFRARYGFTAVALWRDKQSHRTDLATFRLRPGDTLLLMGPQDRANALKSQNDFVVIETATGGDGLDRPKVALTLGIAVIALIAMFMGMPVELAMVTAATLLLLTGLLRPEEAYAAVKWRAIFLIAGTIAVSLAMVQTQLAQQIGDAVVGFVAPFGPLGLVAGTYILSATLTQVMGGQISPLVVGPITIAAAIRLGVNPQAIAVVTAIAGSVSFITPLSHPVNILMIAPANYKFSDFVKSGWILTIVCFIALMIAVPLFWQL